MIDFVSKCENYDPVKVKILLIKKKKNRNFRNVISIIRILYDKIIIKMFRSSIVKLTISLKILNTKKDQKLLFKLLLLVLVQN